ncbi:hypothetical protein KUV89_09865 [Marinobacter hydrocarbonoclasticus]|nr:hypothetical protein [Marinobacter nauticus]
MWHWITGIGISLLLSGCAASTVMAPQHFRMDRPEVDGRALRPSVGLGKVNAREVTLDAGQVIEEVESDLLGRLGLSLGNGVEFGAASAGNASRYSLKYQFSGSYAENEALGNWPQAVSIAVEHTNSDQFMACTFCASADQDLWQMDLALYDVAWILGHRPSAGWLIYGGPYYRFGRLNGQWQSSEQPGASERLNGRTQIWGANLATEYRFQTGLGLTVEMVYANTRCQALLSSEPAVHRNETFLNMVMDWRL